MYALSKGKEEAIEFLKGILPEGSDIALESLEEPPQKDMGDLAFPCFGLAKNSKQERLSVPSLLPVRT
jgi:arginyl-tRNA synthetase